MSTIVIPLSRSYPGHEGSFSSVTLREPTYKDIYVDALGEPQQWQPGADGRAVLITMPDVIDQYVQRLAVSPMSENLLQLNPRDSGAVAKAVLGFFQDGPAPTSSRTPLSSGSDGTPTGSSE